MSIDPRREAVLDELRLHRPADELEAEHLARAIAVTEGTTNPFDRSGFSPGHLTASGFVVDTSGTRVLLIHHGIIDAWLQPGGHVDPEDPDAVSGALREIAEETGVTALTRIGEG
ncbi:NUDIX domain-containing protein, partial [bacterium]|nr:NUDIX domain-containing protein [bacterium]